MPRERTDAGTFAETVTLEDVVRVFDQVRGPVVTSSDVADALDCTTEAARQKLQRLYDRGEVDKRKTGRTMIYWRTGGERIMPDERAVEDHAERGQEVAERRSQNTPDRSDTQTETSSHAARDATESTGELRDDVRAYLEATDQPPKTAHGRGVILDVFQLLREHGTMSTGDLQDETYPDYTDHWGSERTMWNAIDRYLEDIPGIEKGGYGQWTYAGDDAVRETLADSDADPLDSDVYDPTEEF